MRSAKKARVMNPIEISRQLQDTFVHYLGTAFDVNKSGQEYRLAYELRESFNAAGTLFKGPYLELTPPYQTGGTLQALCDEGIITPDLLGLSCFQAGKPIPPTAPLYTHQEQSIRKLLAEEHNIVVSSGTGSGKTECFLIPILDDLLRDPTPGVRAVIIYPLNALVNDQLHRLRTLLKGTEIKFGRYTGELPEKKEDALRKLNGEWLPNEVICRKQIWAGDIPQILITNYAMLEYLLLRPKDAALFDRGTWKFLVLDEAHTYTGAQGVEVAHLIRRLKHRLKHRLKKQTGAMRCIATSATLTNDDVEQAKAFAEALFGEPFNEEDIILGQPDHDYVPAASKTYAPSSDAYLGDEFDNLLQDVHEQKSAGDIAIRLSETGLLAEPYPEPHPEEAVGAYLWRALIGNEHYIELRKAMIKSGAPMLVDEAARLVFPQLAADEQKTALYRLIELCAMARPDGDSPSLLPARYHLFARPPQGVWACINPNCPGKTSPEGAGWSRVFTTKRERCDACDSLVYPLYVCRTCGQVYVRMKEEKRSPKRLLAQDENPEIETEVRYFTWTPIEENVALRDSVDEEEMLTKPWEDFHQEDKTICVRCGHYVHPYGNGCGCEEPAHVILHLVKSQHKRGVKRTYKPVTVLNECPRCHARGIKDTEIATSFHLGGTMPLAVLTEALYRHLPPSTGPEARKRPGQGRKLLSFYDSRQGAARFAAYLQDVVNQKTYRHIIARAVEELYAEYEHWPDFKQVVERSVEIADAAKVFHNDPELSLGTRKRLSQADETRCRNYVQAKVFAEFTTGRRSRTSLEGLGVVAVEYFEANETPDFASLAQEIGLPPATTRTLVELLLDDLRQQKVVTFPKDLKPDDPIFGRHKGNPHVVRGGNYGNGEILWVGKTERHRRNAFVRAVLEKMGVPADEQAVETTLTAIWNWIIENECLERQGGGRYKVPHRTLFFRSDAQWYYCDQCQRLSNHGEFPVCPAPGCKGSLHPVPSIEERMGDNFYYSTFRDELVPMRVEEHTAQLDSEKGRQYQDAFKRGQINVLSCSTTFEMGIDLGDLQAVVLSNVPPTVANYKQRAGRAGRRASGTAFILTWASDRPHDHAYFANPPEIIGGEVRIPYIAIENPYIRQRHVNAILLSEFLRFKEKAGREGLQKAKVGMFFGEQQADQPALYPDLASWAQRRRESLLNTLKGFASMLGEDAARCSEWLDMFVSDMSAVEENYRATIQYYEQAQEQAYRNKKGKEGDHYGRLIERLNRELLINYLSDRSVLPSYSFPLHVVELHLPLGEDDKGLRLQRPTKFAIREYAPGSEIVADKRIWKSGGLIFFRETPKVYEYFICQHCNYLEIAREPGMTLGNPSEPRTTCPTCGQRLERRLQYVEPDAFRCDSRGSGKPAGQYVHREPNIYRYALLPSPQLAEEALTPILRVASQAEGELLYVNEGVWRRGFRLCTKCGAAVFSKENKCPACGNQDIHKLALGHKESTNTLHLRFELTPYVQIPGPEEQSFWLSTMYALIHGASKALQIERRDIGGVLSPRGSSDGEHWEQTIVLFDNVPGGAGHVQRIRDELPAVVEEALRIANCPDCTPDTSCYHCLRDYDNQYHHSLLKRGQAVRFLEALKASFAGHERTGIGTVLAVDRARWLMEQVEQARQILHLAATGVHDMRWLDVLNTLLMRPNTEVHLYLIDLPGTQQTEDLVLRRYLQTLQDKGLHLYQIAELPEWQAVIDPHDHANCRAIQGIDDPLPQLDANANLELTTTVQQAAVEEITSTFAALPAKELADEDLALPPNVEVLHLSGRERVSEEELFGDIFRNPVVTMRVNDPYLTDEYRIVERLGRYVQMAAAGNALQRVDVYTRPARRDKPSDAQKRARDRLEQRYPQVKVHFTPRKTEHDRYIQCTHADGSTTKIIIGVGLDFIDRDGSVRPTHIIIQKVRRQTA